MEKPHALEARFVLALDALGVALEQGVLVAVSGGSDSVTLLRLFCAVRDRLGLPLCAAHLDHGMRGEAAAEDARFVRVLCDSLDVRCVMGARDVPALSARLHTGPEDAARRARYSFLEEARAQTGMGFIALAHHLEDQAETVLLHMVRGSGLAGLAGMRPVRGRYLRPLLGEHREALRGYLRDLGQDWCEDASNADPAYARNRLRTRIVPELSLLNPNLAASVAGMAARLALDEDCLAQSARCLARPERMPYGYCIPIGALRCAHEALRRRALMAAWDGLSPGGVFQSKHPAEHLVEHPAEPPERQALARLHAGQVAELSALLDAEPGQTCNLPGDWHALRGRNHLHLLSPTPDPMPNGPTPLLLAGETVWPGGVLAVRPAAPGERGDGIRTQVLDGDLLSGAVVRFRQPGDRFHPLGAAGSQALKQTLIDRGIDRPFRSLIPLVAREERVLWLIGHLPAQDAAVTGRTVRPLHFTYQGELPWEANPR